MGSPSQGLTRPGHFGTMPDNPEIWKAVAMADHFEKIQKLPDPIPGVPNFRRVPGYKVYCCGQPTAAALETTLNKVCGEIYPKDKKIIWFNMRQEPTVYINGEPVCARPPNKKRAKYRFASKTLMRILPVSSKSEVEGLIEKKAITLDLYEILGQCTWGQKAAEKA